MYSGGPWDSQWRGSQRQQAAEVDLDPGHLAPAPNPLCLTI